MFGSLPAAVRTGVGAAVTGAAAAVCVAVLCWLPDAGVLGHPTSTVRAGLLAFLSAHHGGIVLAGVPAAFLPLGSMLALGAICWRAGVLLAESLPDGTSPKDAVRQAVVQWASYAATCAVLTPLATLGSTRVRLAPTALAAAVFVAATAGTGFARESGLLELPARWRRVLRAAAGAGCVLVGAGALLVAGSIVAHWGNVSSLSRLVGGGLSGVPVLVMGALAAPNAAVAGASYIVGPGFAVGTGTRISAFEGGHGVVPAFPVLGALPGTRAPAAVVILLIAVLVIAGVVTARLAGGVGDAVLAAPVAGAMMALAAWQAGGSLGAGRLRAIGPSPWQVGVALTLETAVVASVASGVTRLGRRPRTDAAAHAEPEPERVTGH